METDQFNLIRDWDTSRMRFFVYFDWLFVCLFVHFVKAFYVCDSPLFFVYFLRILAEIWGFYQELFTFLDLKLQETTWNSALLVIILASLFCVYSLVQPFRNQYLPPPEESFQPRDQTQVSCIAGGFFTVWITFIEKFGSKYQIQFLCSPFS